MNFVFNTKFKVIAGYGASSKIMLAISGGETVDIAYGGDPPSRVVLPVVPVTIAAPAPAACGALRGQPCRTFVPAHNEVALK